MAEANIWTKIASQLEAIGMMNGNATVFIEHLFIIPHSSQFLRPMDRLIDGLLFVKSSFDPTEGTNKNFLRM